MSTMFKPRSILNFLSSFPSAVIMTIPSQVFAPQGGIPPNHEKEYHNKKYIQPFWLKNYTNQFYTLLLQELRAFTSFAPNPFPLRQ